jgi:hypothetical protein
MMKSISEYLNPFKRPETHTDVISNAAYKDMKNDPAGFMVSIIKQQYSLYKKEIEHYLMARQTAISVIRPRRYLLYLLYKDVMTDPVIAGQWNNRVNRVKNKPFKIVDVNTRVENKIKTAYFKKKWFFDYVKFAMESKTHGASLIYTTKLIGNQINAVDIVLRDHVVPEFNQVLYEISDETGPNYLEDPFNKYCIPVGDPFDLGLLEKIAPLYILKKHSWQSWDQFEEMFGVPIRWAKTASTDKKVQAQITKWLQDMGQASYALFPEGTTFDIKESVRSDAFQVFNQKRLACNEEIAMIINGQFETASASGSRAKTAAVVASTQDELTLDDLRFLYYSINDDLLPLMQGLGGYNINPLTDDFEWDMSVELKPLEKLQIYEGVNSMGFELDQEDITNTFGVKIVGKKAPAPPPAAPHDPTSDFNDPPVTQEDDQPKPGGNKNDPTNNAIAQVLNMHHQISKIYSNVQ